MKKVKLNYSHLKSVIEELIKEQNNEKEFGPEYVEIDAKKIKEYLDYVNYKGDMLRRFPEIRGKKVIVVGKLDLRGTPIDTLGPIAKVKNGTIDVTGTSIRSLGDFEDDFKVYYWSTPLHGIMKRKELNRKKAENETFKEDDDWNIEKNDSIGNKANALLEMLRSDGYPILTQEGRDQKKEIENRLEELNERFEETQDEEIKDQITNLEDELSDLEDKIDLYDLYADGDHYDMTRFKILKLEYYNDEYAVGTESEIDSSVLRYAKDSIDSNGVEGFRQSFLEDNIDVDYLVSYLGVDSDVRYNLDVYFSDDDKELSEEQKTQIEELKKRIRTLEEERYDLRSDQDERDNEIETEIEELQEEIDDIESSPDGDIPEDKIEEKIEEREEEIKRNPVYYIREYGFSVDQFVDQDNLAQRWVDQDGYEIMCLYDGSYNIERINDIEYYIVIIDK